MPCLLLIIALAFPRVILVLMWLFSHMLDRAYHGFLIPLIGFFLMPITTVVYAWVASNGRPIDGLNLILIIIAVLMDLSSHGGSVRYRRVRA